MSGIGRLLSKREKQDETPSTSTRKRISMYLSASSNPTPNKSTELIDPNSVADFYGLFSDTSKPNTVEEPKVKSLRQRIIASKSVMVKEENILWALRCNFSKNDADAAYTLLCAMTDASEGIIKPYDPNTKLLGAVNRQAVTCFLDATLFAMFSRLDSFEAMLYNTFEDRPRNRLGFLIRLWVDLLRSGKLITTDITKVIQETLVECGWADAGNLHQQDASEAFTFITEKLQLPLLTLKMDMYHAGKQDADDHRFINERLLEVAIPADENGEHKDIKLEDCLEDYFNNRIEVRRFLERRSTLSTSRPSEKGFSGKTSMEKGYDDKGNTVHVETIEIEDSDTPMTPSTPRTSYISSSRPGNNRSRAPSIIQERFVPDSEEHGNPSTSNATIAERRGRLRGGSIRKEVLMPAWQFFSLIPWYTNNLPSNDAQVAAHFSSKRPILGLCLKRYSMTPGGRTVRLNTFVDIPVEIGLPHFIQDDKMKNDGPIFGNFKLSLQSVVCHRGNSVDSGHYISLVRTTPQDADVGTDYWMRFDDLATQKVTMIDINQALREETPYLVFYQIIPVDGDPGNVAMGENPPSYTDSQPLDSSVSGVSNSPEYTKSITDSFVPSQRPSFELPPANDHRATITTSQRPSFEHSLSNGQRVIMTPSQRPSFETPSSDDQRSTRTPPQRPSFELPPFDDHRATIMPSEKRRPSTMYFGGTPSPPRSTRDESQDSSRRKSASFNRSLSRGSRRFSLTLAAITGSKPKDDRPMSIIPEPTASAENMAANGGTAEDALARLTGEVPDKAPAENGVAERDDGRGRSKKRNKSKNRLTKVYMGKPKGEKPDRECTVM